MILHRNYTVLSTFLGATNTLKTTLSKQKETRLKQRNSRTDIFANKMKPTTAEKDSLNYLKKLKHLGGWS
jgi:hypothetical protein